ncbi:MAG: ribonuclease HII [Thermaurantiacus sp.]
MPAEPGPLVGIDEVGRGPLAGPVVAAAVVLCDPPLAGLADSKRLSPAARVRLDAAIRGTCLVALAAASAAEIDRLNILGATMLAMQRAVAALGLEPALCLVDGNRAPDWPWRTRTVIGGDGSEPAISAASIVAKVARDRLMQRLARVHPAYGWARNMGYPTADHLDALSRLGPSAHHRQSFAPVRNAQRR